MDILRIIYDWPPPWDGLAPHPYELTKSQAKLGHKFYIMSGRWPRQGDIIEPENVELVHFLGSPYVPFREPVKGTMLVTVAPILLLRYILWRRKNDVDLVHSHGHFGLFVYLYRKFLSRFFENAKELETPLVVHFHNTVEGRWRALEEKGANISSTSKYFDWPLAKLADRLAVEIADALIFVSEDTKQDAIEYYGADPSKCYVVETGVNPELFVPVGPEEKVKTDKDIGLEERDKVILNHGIMLERKNIHLLVESLKYLPEYYKLFLAGPFDSDAYLERVDDLIQQNGLEDRVVMSGYTPYPQVPIAYQASDVFVLPSSYEGLPKVVMQSIACGVPALVSGFEVKEEISGLFYLKNLEPQNIADQIKKIIEERPFVDAAKIGGLYSWDRRAEEVERIYEKLVNR